jgi:hypothetical protein
MKHDPLQRLLRSAALAQRPEPAADMTFWNQTRILAAWRNAREHTESVLPVLRKAIVAACAITALALVSTLATVHKNEPAEVDEVVSATNSLNDAINFVWAE